METGDSFELPRYNNAVGQPSYPMYGHDNPGVARGHHRISSILSGEQSPISAPAGPSDSAAIHRSNSLSSSFYPSALASAYRQDSTPSQQLHPYQTTPAQDMYSPSQDYAGSYAPRRSNTQTAPKGVTLSPRSSLRQQQQPTSPSISVTMDTTGASSAYGQHQSGQHYGSSVGGAPVDSYAPPATASAIEPSTSYPQQHSDVPSPSPSGNTYSQSAYASQPSLYPAHLPPQSSDPYSAAAAASTHYASQQQTPLDMSRSGSTMQSTSARVSASTPNTPLSQRTYQSSIPPPQQMGYYQQPPPIEQPLQQSRRLGGLRRVRDARDLRPLINPQPAGRRADPNGSGFLSPLKSLTTHISTTYNICNPQFRYEMAHNPRRVLTKPSKPTHNDGYDNEDYDYILYVNDWLGTEEGHSKYLILDILGQGTFGQVVKCQNMKTHEIVAVKVVKNKPAYFNQSMMEVQILKMLNDECDPGDVHHILRLRETFIHKSHLCLVFELLSSNLYELIKQNQFGGLSTQLVKVFTSQLLDALTVLKEAQLIHCDLKPENILLKSLQSPTIKVIDFGSACHEQQTVYTYIQSRFYRSPEVLLGLPYNAAIDMWSLGCIAVELFLGLPLFPGTSEYNQITRIVEMLGLPPTFMLEKGKQAANFFVSYAEYNQKHYRLKTLEQYSREHGTNEQPGKKYFPHSTLPEIIRNAPIQKSSSKSKADIEKEQQHRESFIDFVSGLLNLNPWERWTPQQARSHPFITGEKFVKPFVPPPIGVPNGRSSSIPNTDTTTMVNSQAVDPKRPYGGLVPAPPKGNRAYQDANAYNQRLAQHQAQVAQHQAAQAAASSIVKNPYYNTQQTTGNTSQNGQGAYAYSGNNVGQPPPSGGQQQYRSKDVLALDPYASQQQQQRQASYASGGGALSSTAYPQQHTPNQPPSSYYPNSRGRANTINQLDAVPAQLRGIQLDLESSPGVRNTLTPVLTHREESMKDWERRGMGGKTAPGPAFQQLEYLQQQVEMDGGNRWASAATHRYAPTQPSNLAFQTPPAAVVVDSQQDKNAALREAALSSVRTAAGLGGGSSGGGGGRYDANVPAPPQPAYNAGSPMVRGYSGNGSIGGGGGSYSGASQQQQSSSGQQSAYDGFDHRDGLASLYPTMQPNQYGNGSYSGGGGGGGGGTGGQTPGANSNQSFYSAGVVAAAGGAAAAANNAFGTQQAQKEARRMSGMDLWQTR